MVGEEVGRLRDEMSDKSLKGTLYGENERTFKKTDNGQAGR